MLVVCLLGWFVVRTPNSSTMYITELLTLYYFIHILAIVPYLGKLNDSYHSRLDEDEKS